ncbi:MAG: 7-cyano-7-deazaguanine synthase [Rhodanobacter sp.]
MPSDLSAVFVHYEPGRVSLSGAVEQNVTITAQSMLNHLLETASQRSIDLVAIATGIYAIDRVCKRKLTRQNECGVRTLRVVFEVSDLLFWQRPDIVEQLVDIICMLSGDTWLVSFAKRSEPHQTTNVQRSLDLQQPLPTRVALYSGGLDSAAGLANRLVANDQTYMLLTVGHHVAVRSQCLDQVQKLRQLLRTPMLHHASFMVRFDGGVAGKMKLQEKSQRARGFLFCAAAALLANACNIEDVELFENGVGAINLPLTEGGLTDGLSTRGAHPGFLAKMGFLVSAVLDTPFRFSLPFLNATKAEMVRPLSGRPLLAEWLQQSCSCIHTSLRVRGKRHCGHCPACIERRQAFRSGGISDGSKDYDVDLFAGGVPADFAYLMSYLENARWWSTGHARVKSRLARHCILTDSTHVALGQIESMLARHANESLLTYGGVELLEAA